MPKTMGSEKTLRLRLLCDFSSVTSDRRWTKISDRKSLCRSSSCKQTEKLHQLRPLQLTKWLKNYSPLSWTALSGEACSGVTVIPTLRLM